MAGAARIFSFSNLLSALVLLLGLFGCSASQPPAPAPTATPTPPVASAPRPLFNPPPEVATPSIIKPAPIFPVMLGIDVLERI